MTSDPLRWLAATVLLLAWLLLCAGIRRQRRATQEAARKAARALEPGAAEAEPVLVAHASQTGTAEGLAWQTARLLHAAGVPARLVSLADLSADLLRSTRRALLLVSSYGEGDPPDSAAAFARRVMGDGRLALGGLQVGVLALGDSGYRHYCGFGRRLDGWLAACGAQMLFPRVEVDNGDPRALAEWQRHVAHLAGHAEAPAPIALAEAPFQPWRLAARRCLNPGSLGEPIHHLELEPPAGLALPDWEAGDLAQVLPPRPVDGTTQVSRVGGLGGLGGVDAATRADRDDREDQADGDGRPRDYSIASLPSDGRLHLLVRRARRLDGTPGAASRWLTATSRVGDTIALRLRPHPGFRIGANGKRPLILIGNGSGIAGLRAHLKARAGAHERGTAPPVWLLFGERQAAHDALYAEDIAAWQVSGLLARADLVYSRDGNGPRYVQDRLRECADELRDWIGRRGAAIYVCGSLQGMAGGVEQALQDTLGTDEVDRLVAAGRLRRDVY